ncbi:MAG: hypothetical protein LBS36_07910 [Oscillospiraceae bacterium]|jgi:hypothetical protein|nr:hypothetical protein [Oscillospiraceae bacterium]
MKKTKKMFALLVALAFVFSFSVLAAAEETSAPSFSDAAGAAGDKLTDLIGSLGGDSEFDFSSLFAGLGALGDIDISGYLSNINIGSISEDLKGFAGNFFNTDGAEMPDLGGIADDIGIGNFAGLIQDGLDSVLGIGGSTSGDEESSSGGFSDIISGFAGSIADMTGNFDIAEVIGGLMGGGSSGSSSGTGTDTNTTPTTTAPSNNPAVIIGGGSSSNNGSSVTVPTEQTEITTQEFTTQRVILQPIDQDVPSDDTPEKNTGKVVAGVILVLGSFGAVAYIVIKKVI